MKYIKIHQQIRKLPKMYKTTGQNEHRQSSQNPERSFNRARHTSRRPDESEPFTALKEEMIKKFHLEQQEHKSQH